MVAHAYPSNDQLSHAGPKAPDTPQDEFLVLADVFGSAFIFFTSSHGAFSEPELLRSNSRQNPDSLLLLELSGDGRCRVSPAEMLKGQAAV